MLQILWNTIAYIGIRYTKSSFEHKYTILVNGLTLFVIIINLVFMVVSYLFGDFYAALVDAVYMFLLFFVFYFNSKGKLLLAKNLSVIFSFIYVFTLSLLLGNLVRGHLFFLILLLAALFIFTREEKIYSHIYLVLCIISFLAFEYVHSELRPLNEQLLTQWSERQKFIREMYTQFFFVGSFYFFAYYIQSTFQKSELRTLYEYYKSEKLLKNILPEKVIKQLRENPDFIAEKFENCTILFSDIVGFTKLSHEIHANKLVHILNEIFSHFDDLAEKYCLEKIKTIGDAYMVVGGVPIPREDHAEKVAEFALEIKDSLREFSVKYDIPLEIRVGINSGEVVAGVIGKKKFIYDLWGASVNLASRMESNGVAGQIQVSESTYELLKNKYEFEYRGATEMKGLGEVRTYFLLRKK